jgi:general secretion pathway protein D
MHWRRYFACGVSVLLLTGCASELQRREGMSLLQAGNYEQGLAKLAKASQDDPTNVLLQKDYLRQREQIVNRLVNSAGSARATDHYDAAEALYRRALSLEPNSVPAMQGLADLITAQRHAKLMVDAQSLAKSGDIAGAKATIALLLVENPNHVQANQLRYQLEEQSLKENISGPTLNIKGRKPVTLQFRDANLKMVLEAISRTTGVNVLLDKDVRNDIKVTIFVKDTPVEETLDLILFQNQLEKRVLGENTVLVYPFNPAKSKDYQELKVRRFSLTNADPKQIQNMIKTILKTKDIFVDEKTNSIVIRDTPQAVRLAEKLVASMDQPEPEVMLEVELLDVNRNRTLALGIDWPTQVTWAYSNADGTLGGWKNRDSSKNVTVGANNNFSVVVKALESDGDTRVLATPRIRARNKEKAKIMIGSRTPVISSAAAPSTVAGASSVYNTNIQYLDTGIKFEAEPTIYLDGDVAIKINLEISDLGDKFENTTTGTLAYATTTNNATTVLRLKDGETQVLAGLLRAYSNNGGSNKIPGLGDIPLLGRLFGMQTDKWENREIVLAVTPHIIRNNQANEADLLEMWSGTESNVKFGVSNLKVAGTAGVLGQGATGAGSPAVPPPAARPGLPGMIIPAAPTRATAPPVVTAPAALAAGPLAVTLAGPQQAKIGDKLNVIISAQPGASVHAVTFAVRYDVEFLKAVAVTEGDLMRKANLKSTFNGQIDEAGGSVAVDLNAEGGAAGGGGIASIQFEVVGGRGATAVSVPTISATGANSAELPVSNPSPLSVTVQAPP